MMEKKFEKYWKINITPNIIVKVKCKKINEEIL